MSQLLLNRVQSLVEKAAAYQRSRFRTLHAGHGGEAPSQVLVTDVELHTEQLLVSGLAKLVPEAAISAQPQADISGQPSYWVIEPLDGGVNYVSGLDHYAISVALVVNGRTELGLVYRPQTQECFRAWRGGRFQYNGRAVTPLNTELKLEEAVIGTGFPHHSADLAPAFVQCAEAVIQHGRCMRRMGSAALDMSFVAAGFLQGAWGSDLRVNDIAAGLLFLELSGCLVTNESGRPYQPSLDRILVCGWPVVHAELQPLVGWHYANPASSPDALMGGETA